MELRQLRYFIAVAEELHFGRAAERLGISQPPLSQQLRALEQELGALLLERTTRRVRLTDAGRLFLDQARLTVAQAEQAIATVRRARAGEEGELAIGFTSSAPFVAKVAAGLLAFRTAAPAVHLRLAEMARDAQIAAIAEGRLDVGFVRSLYRPLLPAGVLATAFLQEDMIVAMRRDHPLARADVPLTAAMLADESFVQYERDLGAGFYDAFDRLCDEAGFRARVVQEASGLATLLGLVTAGFGITVLPRSLGALHVDDLVYRPLDEPGAISRLWLVHATQPSSAARRFLTLFGQDAAELGGRDAPATPRQMSA